MTKSTFSAPVGPVFCMVTVNWVLSLQESMLTGFKLISKKLIVGSRVGVSVSLTPVAVRQVPALSPGVPGSVAELPSATPQPQ